MSLATEEDTNDVTVVNIPKVPNHCSTTAKIVPVSLHDVSLQALLTSVPQLSPVLSRHSFSHHTIASTSSSHSQETSPTTSTRQPFCIDRSILVRPLHRFTHKRNKSAPLWLHNPSSVVVSRGDPALRRNSCDELYKLKEVEACLAGALGSGSTDEGVSSCYESGSTPSTEPDKIDDKSVTDSCSCDADEAYNTDSSAYDYAGFPGLVSSATWIEVQSEQDSSDLVCVKVGSKSSHVVHFSVKAGDVITWEFATIKRDIGFGILFECSVVEEKETKDGEMTDVDSITSGYGVIPILPIFKVKSNISPIFGSHEAVTDGVYVMTWDNSYSRFFAKDLYYRISTQTEIYSSEYPNGIISFQHSICTHSSQVCSTPLVEESGSSEGGGEEQTLCCDSSDTDKAQLDVQWTSDPAPTVYFDVSRHNVQDL